MADRMGTKPTMGVNKPVPMKLFATWEIDRSAPSCIPRLCSLKLTRLLVLKMLDTDLTSILIAVKMQNSKRVLRSNEIVVPPSGILDTELDLSFSLQYPHFLKRDGNVLQIMLQRRKRYKNRTILGYKNLAIGEVNMAQVLQKNMDRELCLYCSMKEKEEMVAKVTMLSLTSQPVDQEETLGGRQKQTSETDSDQEKTDAEYPFRKSHAYSDLEEEYSSNDEGSDSEPVMELEHRRSKGPRGKGIPSSQQGNLKKRFYALLKRFKVSEEVLGDSEHEQDDEQRKQEIEDLLFEEISNLSDSGPEMDNMSISSTPKPGLRPYFSARSSSHDILTVPEIRMKYSKDLSDGESSRKGDSDNQEFLTDDHDGSDGQQRPESPPRVSETEIMVKKSDTSKKISRPSSPPSKPKFFTRESKSSSLKNMNPEKRTSKDYGGKLPLERKSSGGLADQQPRKALLEQLQGVLGPEELMIDSAILVDASEKQGLQLAHRLQELSNHRIVATVTTGDVKATMSHLVNKLQKFCHTNSQAPTPIRVAIVGGDRYINSILRPYVEHFSLKSPDWQNYLRFLVIPLGSSISLAKYIGSIDNTYHSLFLDILWRDAFEKGENHKPDSLYQEAISRITRYITTASLNLHLPIAEAMIACKERSADEESSQVFTPFVIDVKIGCSECVGYVSTSVELVEDSPTAPLVSSSPPSSSHLDKPKDTNGTPPGSPSVSGNNFNNKDVQSPTISADLDLQVEYWLTPGVVPSKESVNPLGRDKKDASGKLSIKSTFRSLVVSKLPAAGDQTATAAQLSMTFVTKEKKQKIMRIGKKSREKEAEIKQTVESIQRLICMCKSSNSPLKVTIDGTEWTGVKFFQLSAQWQTNTKLFPLAIFTQPDYLHLQH